MDLTKVYSRNYADVAPYFFNIFKSFLEQTRSIGELKYYYEHQAGPILTHYESLMYCDAICLEANNYDEAQIMNATLRCLLDGNFSSLMLNEIKTIEELYYQIIRNKSIHCKDKPIRIQNMSFYSRCKLNFNIKILSEIIYSRDELLQLLDEQQLVNIFNNEQARLNFVLGL